MPRCSWGFLNPKTGGRHNLGEHRRSCLGRCTHFDRKHLHSRILQHSFLYSSHLAAEISRSVSCTARSCRPSKTYLYFSSARCPTVMQTKKFRIIVPPHRAHAISNTQTAHTNYMQLMTSQNCVSSRECVAQEKSPPSPTRTFSTKVLHSTFIPYDRAI